MSGAESPLRLYAASQKRLDDRQEFVKRRGNGAKKKL
jgi:hypothetical protein